MKPYIIYLNLLLLGALLSSCSKDWLDKKPSQEITVPSTLKDFQAILDNESLTANSPALSEVSSDGHYLLDATYLSRSDIEKNAYIWSNDYSYAAVSDWNNVYSNIFDCNIVLEGMEKVSPESNSSKATWNNIKGQALFHRAKAFYELSQIFSAPYILQTAEIDLGIPLRLESDITIKTTRSSALKTYNLVTSDLLLAKDLLPVTQSYKTRPTKIAAFALLARIYLSMEEYHKAKAFSDSVLNNYNTLINYNVLTPNLSFPLKRFNDEVIFHSTILNYSSIGVQLRIDSVFKVLYKEGDLRPSVFFGSNGGLVTFKGSYNGARANYSGLATDEQYLIRAECFARLGMVPEAMEDLNYLLQHRWDSSVTYVKQTAMDAEDALRQILLERRKELLLRGLRWSDLRRLNRDPRFDTALTRTVAGQTYTLNPTSFKYTFPIPDDIIEITGLQQNPGWER